MNYEPVIGLQVHAQIHTASTALWYARACGAEREMRYNWDWECVTSDFQDTWRVCYAR